MITNELRAVAYHEAGHAIIAKANKIRLYSISIIPDEASLGRFNHQEWSKTTNRDGLLSTPDVDSSTKNRWLVERLVKYSLAGGIAQRKFEQMHSSKTRLDIAEVESGDLEAAVALVSHFSGSDDVLEAYLNYLAAQTKLELDDPEAWELVEKLAEILLEKKHLTARELNHWFKERIP